MCENVNAIGLDTLKAARSLQAAGFSEAQAEALVTVLGGPVLGGAATRDDVRYLRFDTNAELRDLRAELTAEIKRCRSELTSDIARLRDETRGAAIHVV